MEGLEGLEGLRVRGESGGESGETFFLRNAPNARTAGRNGRERASARTSLFLTPPGRPLVSCGRDVFYHRTWCAQKGGGAVRI